MFFPFVAFGQTDYDLYEKGRLEITKSNPELALEYINKAIQLRPDYCEYYVTRAIWRMSSLDNMEQSIRQLEICNKDIDKAIDLGCERIQPYSIKGFIFKKMGLIEQSKEYYKKALILLVDTTNYSTYDSRASIKTALGDFNGAIKDYNKVMFLNKKYGNTLYGLRGFCKEKLKDYRGAISDYTKQIDLNNLSPGATGEIYFKRGWMKKKLNDTKGACQDWTIAGELGYMTAFNSINAECNGLIY